MNNRSSNEGPPHLIIERGYWQDPVQVFTGALWLVVGLAIGITIAPLLP